MINMRKPVGLDAIQQREHDQQSWAHRASEAGLYMEPQGTVAAATNCPRNAPIKVFNSSAAVKFVAFGDSPSPGVDPTIPTTGAMGQPIPAGAVLILNSGPHNRIVATDATVFVYWDPNLM